MKPYSFIILFLVLSVTLCASGLILKEVNEPKTLNVSGDSLVISESESVLIYSLSGKKVIRKFGKNGEGPGEFKLGHGAGSLKIDIINDQLLINSGGKISWFTMQGEFIKEMKTPPMTYLIPLGKGYIGNCLSPVENNFPSLSVCLFNTRKEKKGTIFNSGVPVGMGAKIMVPSYNFKYRVAGGRVYLSTGKESIHIRIFDEAGKQIREISLKNSLYPVDTDFKERVYDFYKNDPVYKNYWNYLKQNMYFPDYFPGLKDLIVDGNRICIQTYKLKGQRFEWIIVDMKGKVLKRIFLPQNIESAVAYSPVTISGRKYFYLTEDLEEEEWELHSIDLERMQGDNQ